MINKDEKIADAMAGMRSPTPEDMEYLKQLHQMITGVNLCKNQGCKNTRAAGSSRCKECSQKYKANVT